MDDIADQVWSAPAVEAQPVVKVGDKTLVKDLDYTLEYKDNDGVGTATVTITAAGAYAGRAAAVDKEFTIVAQNLSGATIGAIEEQVFKGSPVTPEPVVTDADGVELVKGVDYDLSYKNNDKAGTGTVVVTGKGNYTGTQEATFTIKSNSAGAALCGKKNSVLILADDGNSNTVDNVVKPNKKALEKSCYIFGGKTAVSETVYNKVLTASK